MRKTKRCKCTLPVPLDHCLQSSPHGTTPRTKPHQFSHEKSNSIKIVWISHDTRSDKILYRRDTYVTTSGDATAQGLTIQHRIAPHQTTLTEIHPRANGWFNITAAPVDIKPAFFLSWTTRMVTEEGLRRRKEKRRGWVERGWSRKYDATPTTKSKKVGATAASVVRASSTRELYLNAVAGRGSRGVAKQRVCHDRRRR